MGDILALNFWHLSTARWNWILAGLGALWFTGLISQSVILNGKSPLSIKIGVIFCTFAGIFMLSGGLIAIVTLLCLPLQVLRKGTLGPKTFTISDEDFTEDDGRIVTKIAWDKVRSIYKTRNHIFIRISRMRYFILSGRDFPDQAVFAQYYATLERFRRDASNTSNTSESSRESRPPIKGGEVPPFLVRPLMPSDAEAYRTLRLQALHEQPPAFGALPHDEPTALETAARLDASGDRCIFGALSEDQLVGVVRVSRYASSNEKHRAYLAGLYVLPAHRKSGFGRALATAAITWASNAPGIRRLNLTVVTSQTAAISLYESLGFWQYGIERETFSDGGRFFDEALMTLVLAS